MVEGFLDRMNPVERENYYNEVCRSLGLNPLTRPFEYLMLDGKLVLYPCRGTTDQLRANHGVSILSPVERETQGDLYIVRVRARTRDGREDEAEGCVSIVKEGGEWRENKTGKRYFAGNGEMNPLRGDALANARMRAETKAKRRVTLSICGLGWLDETEMDTIPPSAMEKIDPATGEILESPKAPSDPPSAGNIKDVFPDPPAPPKSGNGGNQGGSESRLLDALLAHQVDPDLYGEYLVAKGILQAGQGIQDLPENTIAKLLLPGAIEKRLAAYEAWGSEQDRPDDREEYSLVHQATVPESSAEKLAKAEALAPMVTMGNDGTYLVPASAPGAEPHRAISDAGGWACDCAGYLFRVGADPGYQCSHIMAAKLAAPGIKEERP